MLSETFPDTFTLVQEPSQAQRGIFVIKITPQLEEGNQQYFCSCVVRGEYRQDTEMIDYSIVEEEADGLSTEQID